MFFNRLASGQCIPSWVHGKAYRVQQVSGDRVLLAGIMSWISRNDVEVLQTSAQAKQTSGSTYTVQSGDSWWSIANRYGMNMYTLASRTYAVRRGDTLSNIANRLEQSVYKLAQKISY